MRSYAVRRSLTVIPVLLGVSVLVFSFVHLIPGDPATAMLGERATPERADAVRKQLGLDRPIYEQYLLYMSKVIRGDLGRSIVRGDPVLPDILRRFPATVELATAAIVLALLGGIPIGIVSAVWRRSLVDSLARVWALVGVSDAHLLAGADARVGLRGGAPMASDRLSPRGGDVIRAPHQFRDPRHGPQAGLGGARGCPPPHHSAVGGPRHDPARRDRADDAGQHARGALA